MELICENNVPISKCCCQVSEKDNVATVKYHLPAEHDGGRNNETQRNHTNIKQRGVLIQSNKENRCHFISFLKNNSV